MKTTSKPKKGEAKLFEQIAQYIQQQKNNTFNYKQVSAAIGAKTGPKQRIVAMRLYELSLDGEIVEVAPGKYKAPNRSNIMTGTFVRRSNGKNSVVTDEDGESIFVAERNSMHALNGDKVRVMVSAARRGAEPEAEVVEILEKNDQVFIGVLTVERGYALLNTDSKFLATDIFIPKEKLRGGKTGDKVVARITAWPEHANMPKGEVVDVLGKNGDNNTEIHAILAEFGLPYKYPEAVERAAKRIGPGITPEEIAKREDCREVLTFTIDPKDAKDFDDALSIRKLANGHYEVGVHAGHLSARQHYRSRSARHHRCNQQR